MGIDLVKKHLTSVGYMVVTRSQISFKRRSVKWTVQ